MINVKRKNAPPHYVGKVRLPGSAFIAKHSLTANNVPKYFRWARYWRHIVADLKSNFGDRCGYCAMWIPGPGEVDHYISKTAQPKLAYEWKNFRFADAPMNKRKAKHDGKVLDPYVVKDNWFEVDIFTGKISPTKSVPRRYRQQAEDTIRLLRLNDRTYKNSRLKHIAGYEAAPSADALAQTQNLAPLVASAIERFWNQKRSAQ